MRCWWSGLYTGGECSCPVLWFSDLRREAKGCAHKERLIIHTRMEAGTGEGQGP